MLDVLHIFNDKQLLKPLLNKANMNIPIRNIQYKKSYTAKIADLFRYLPGIVSIVLFVMHC